MYRAEAIGPVPTVRGVANLAWFQGVAVATRSGDRRVLVGGRVGMGGIVVNARRGRVTGMWGWRQREFRVSYARCRISSAGQSTCLVNRGSSVRIRHPALRRRSRIPLAGPAHPLYKGISGSIHGAESRWGHRTLGPNSVSSVLPTMVGPTVDLHRPAPGDASQLAAQATAFALATPAPTAAQSSNTSGIQAAAGAAMLAPGTAASPATGGRQLDAAIDRLTTDAKNAVEEFVRTDAQLNRTTAARNEAAERGNWAAAAQLDGQVGRLTAERDVKALIAKTKLRRLLDLLVFVASTESSKVSPHELSDLKKKIGKIKELLAQVSGDGGPSAEG